MKRVLLMATVCGLALPANAFAHATLERTSPSFRERLAVSPAQITLKFDQYVKVLPQSVRLYSAHGSVPITRIRADGRLLKATLARLPKGPYTVRWHAMSGDGHVVSGVFTFGVRVRAPEPTEAFGASGPTRTEDVVRWLYFLSLALLVGGMGFRLLVMRRPLPGRFYALTAVGAFATLNVGIAAFILRAEDALQLPFGRLLYGDLSPIAHTRFGTAFIAMTLGFALVTALLFLAWLTDREVFLWPAFLIGLGFASGLSLSGHSAADAGSSWKSELADWAHLSAASLWIGGLAILAFVVWPLLAPRDRLRRRSAARGRLPRDPAPAAAQRSLDHALRADPARQDRAGRACIRVGWAAQGARRAEGRKRRCRSPTPCEPDR
jgi:copper transport protein